MTRTAGYRIGKVAKAAGKLVPVVALAFIGAGMKKNPANDAYMPSPETTQNAAQPGAAERFRINSMVITSRGGNMRFDINATSLKDSTRDDGKTYASGSGDLTKMNLTLEDNMNGSTGTDLPDVRAWIKKLEYKEPNVNNRADVEMIVNTGNYAVNNKHVMAVYPTNEYSDVTAYFVDQIELTGKGVPVIINGDNLGQNQFEANAIVNRTEPTGSRKFGSYMFRVNFAQTSRKVIPEGGSTQLRSFIELVRPN